MIKEIHERTECSLSFNAMLDVNLKFALSDSEKWQGLQN